MGKRRRLGLNQDVPIDERLPDLYKVDQGTGCWNWTGTIAGRGYGQLTVNGEQVYAHRFAYQWFTGEDPNDFHVCHRCDNPSCVNPDHLFLGTRKDNMQDASAKGRMRNGGRQGTANAAARITEDDVKAIRSAVGLQKEIAERFGVSRMIVSKIKTRRTWSHIP